MSISIFCIKTRLESYHTDFILKYLSSCVLNLLDKHKLFYFHKDNSNFK